MPEFTQPSGIARVDTEATLVNDAGGKGAFDDSVSLPPWDEEDEEGDEFSSNEKAAFAFAFESDDFALQTIGG